MFLGTGVAARGDSLPAFVTEKEIKSVVSEPGGSIQYDSRDNILTPNRGVRLEASFFWSNTITGSDYNFWRINTSAIGYRPFGPRFVGGLRLEGEQVLGTPPFYLLPFVNLTGIPIARYQGNTALESEGEARWDLYKRWSLVFSGGVGAAFDSWDNMGQHPLVYSYGTGFRYLIARKFRLRMGMDVARGPEKWAYYIVFGSKWFR
jgi:hypothetical protein